MHEFHSYGWHLHWKKKKKTCTKNIVMNPGLMISGSTDSYVIMVTLLSSRCDAHVLAIIVSLTCSYHGTCIYTYTYIKSKQCIKICTKFLVVQCHTKSTLAGRVCNCHSSILLAFLHINVTIRHQIADVEQAVSHLVGPFCSCSNCGSSGSKQQLATVYTIVYTATQLHHH